MTDALFEFHDSTWSSTITPAFDMNAATQARDTAIATVADNANPSWRRAALTAVRRVAGAQATFSTDDVWRVLDADDASTHERKALGAIMTAAAREGLCVVTDRYEQSERVACHRRPLRVWRSLIHSPLTQGNDPNRAA